MFSAIFFPFFLIISGGNGMLQKTDSPSCEGCLVT